MRNSKQLAAAVAFTTALSGACSASAEHESPEIVIGPDIEQPVDFIPPYVDTELPIECTYWSGEYDDTDVERPLENLLDSESVRPSMLNPYLERMNANLPESYRMNSVDTLINWSGCTLENPPIDAHTLIDPSSGETDIRMLINAEMEPMSEKLYQQVIDHESWHVYMNHLVFEDSQLVEYTEVTAAIDKLFDLWLRLWEEKDMGVVQEIEIWLSDPEDFRMIEEIIYPSLDIDLQTGTVLERDGSLFSEIFDESAYNGTFGGHPFDSFDELGASAYTIALHYPQEFIAKTNALEPDKAALAKQVMSHVIHIVSEFGAQGRDEFLKNFSPDLIDFLGL